jgi:hypothetical protein
MKIQNIDQFFERVHGGLTTFSDLHQLYKTLKAKGLIAEIIQFAKKSVAADETPDKENYDFQCLEDALTWVMEGSVSPNTIILLKLAEGTHYLIRDPNQPTFAKSNIPAYYFSDIVLMIEGENSDRSKQVIKYPNDMQDITATNPFSNTVFRFQSCKFGAHNVTFDFSRSDHENTEPRNFGFMRLTNTYISFFGVDIIFDYWEDQDGTKHHTGTFWFSTSGGNSSYSSGVTVKNCRLAFIQVKGASSLNFDRITFDNCQYIATPYSLSTGCFLNFTNAHYVNGSTEPEFLKHNQITGAGLVNIVDTHIPMEFQGWDGPSSSRPNLLKASGQSYFDTDLGIPIWYNGSNWVDANGSIV